MSLYGGIELVGRPDLENVRRLDLLPMRAVREMMQYGFAIDIPYLDQLTEELTAEMEELRYEILSYIPADKLDEFIRNSNMDAEDDYLPMNVESSVQLASLLFDTLGIGKGHQLKLTKSGDRASTGKKQLEQRKRDHPIVQKVLDYRERSKLRNTYTSALPKLAKFHGEGQCWCGLKHQAETWRVHTQILTTRTSTGRFASKAPNLQNVSARSELGRRVRRAFVASPGTKLVSVDFSQIEVRLTADYTGDPNLLRIFALGLDPHEDTARRAFGLRVDEKPDKLTQRDPSKTTTFLVIYSGSELALYDTLVTNFANAKTEKYPNGMPPPDWLTQEWCRLFIEMYTTELYPTIPEYWDKQDYRARRYGVVWTKTGRIRRVPEVRSVHKRVVSAGLRQSRNAPIQGFAADINKLAIAIVQEEVVEELRNNDVWCWPLMTVHDEWIGEVDDEYAELIKDQVMAKMSDVLRDRDTGEWMCKVPIEADGKVMERWSK
jgi:DNA polymerase I